MATNRKRRGRFWPTRIQEQLLVAALGDPEDAPVVWREVQPQLSLDELEPGSFELLPLIYRNLSHSGYEDSSLLRLKGIYRRAWVKNNLLLERTRDIADALRADGISALFLEGPVLALRYYPDLGLRPTSSIHLLVRDADEASARERLQRAGWSDRPGSGAYAGLRFLFDEGGNICVLRRGIAFDFAAGSDPASSEAPLWEGAESQDAAGTQVLVPGATDALLAICVAGARAGPIPSTQWIADASMLLRSQEIDWDRLLELGMGRGQTLRLRDALDYLGGLPATGPPEEVCARLRKARVTGRERLIHFLSSGSVQWLGSVPEELAEHVAATPRASLVRTIATFPRRLRARWGLEHGWQLPFAAGRRAARLVAGSGKRTR
jgi:hypothetical protein